MHHASGVIDLLIPLLDVTYALSDARRLVHDTHHLDAQSDRACVGLTSHFGVKSRYINSSRISTWQYRLSTCLAAHPRPREKLPLTYCVFLRFAYVDFVLWFYCLYHSLCAILIDVVYRQVISKHLPAY